MSDKCNCDSSVTSVTSVTVTVCETCRYYRAPRPTEANPAAGLWGHCYYHPPMLVVVGDAEYLHAESGRPETDAGSFCGKWQPRETGSDR